MSSNGHPDRHYVDEVGSAQADGGGIEVGTDANIAAWMAAIGQFNRGDVGPFLDLLDPDVKWVAAEATVEGRDAVRQMVVQLRGEGWTEHRITSISGQGPVVVSTFVNVFNGGEYAGGGAGVFNDAGRVASMASFDEDWNAAEG